jgi:hypothetical protein
LIWLVDVRSASPSEILLLARVLTRVPPADRFRSALAILLDADEAQNHLMLTGIGHADFGDGSLMSRCHRLCPPSEPMADDPDFLVCVALAANALLFHSCA